MDAKTEFYVKLGIASAVGIGLAAIVYSRSAAVIYFWECTYAVRVCILLNVIIFFFISTIGVMGILYFPNLIKHFRGSIKESSKNESVLASQIKSELINFRETLRPFKNASSNEKKKIRKRARKIMNTLLNKRLPDAERVFVEHKDLREKLVRLDVAYQDYCAVFKRIEDEIFSDIVNKRELWGTKPNDENALEIKLFMLVDEIIDFLNYITADVQIGVMDEK